ncbi:hypothetical protein OH77DRAFT_152471 [Trametes cingulata]|nr:hypothetical protein OH77DRAFT_152471 [Trametes cingulata]
MVAECGVLAATWSATATARCAPEPMRVLAPGTQSPLSLSGVLFRDGALYLIIILLVNLARVIFALLTAIPGDSPASGTSALPSLSSLVIPLTSAAISHFLVDLHEAARGGSGTEGGEGGEGLGGGATICFARVDSRGEEGGWGPQRREEEIGGEEASWKAADGEADVDMDGDVCEVMSRAGGHAVGVHDRPSTLALS